MTTEASRATDKQPHVSVCICTFKRASVAATIDSVLAQVAPAGVSFEVLVADDDPDASARDLVESRAQESVIPVKYLFSGARNISRCRNLCLESSQAPWIAFIDDDEVAAPNWLTELLSARDQFNADGVKGFVQAVYPHSTPNWIKQGDPFTCDYGPTGTDVRLGATGNVLFSRRLVEAAGLRFDPELGRTGGEDLDFFEKLKKQGFRLVSCRTAIVFEGLPDMRVTIPFLIRRSRRFGHIDGRVIVARRTSLAKGWVISKAIAAVALCSCYPVMRRLNHRLAWTTFGRFWYHLGVLEWAFGRSSPKHE